MANAQIGPGTFLGTALVTLVLSIGLGELYSYSIATLHVKPWLGVLAAHSGLALLMIMARKSIRDGLKVRGTPLLAWLAGPVVLLGAFLLAKSTPYSGVPYSPSGSSEMIYALATLTVIPFVEEIVFRMGITPIISRFVGGWWALWFSAIIFSLAHTHPSWDRVLGLEVGLPLGPFLLAICCDMIVIRWGRVWPAVLFHAACNATVYVFAKFNPSWLTHLGGLYM